MSDKNDHLKCRSLANLCNSQAQHINQLRRENEALRSEVGQLRLLLGLNRKRPSGGQIYQQEMIKTDG